METRQQPCVASSVINGIKADSKRPDGNLCTMDGSLDRYGRPVIKGRTGGWRCAMFILVNQGLVTLAFAAVEVNLVLFSKSVLRQSNAEAANTFSRWMGTMYLFSLMGAFLSDSYLGRYLTYVSHFRFSTLLLIALSLVTQLSLLKPQGCGKLGQLREPHSSAETVVFYVAIYMITLGNGAPEPAFAAFGADQFDEEDNTEKQSKNSFYSYFYVALNMGSLVAETVLVYIQNLGNWILGCAACAALAFCLLLCGTFQYRHFKAVGNPISGFSQVIVASMRKTNFQVPSNGEGLYEVERKQGKNNGVRRILHTNGFKYLDRAAIITPVDMVEPANPWHLCTITQVEEVTKREPKPPSELQRIGIGIAMAMASMIIAAIVEQQRLKHADSKNTRGLSIFWQIPQYVLVGVSEAFVYVAQMEFFATQTPDGLKSLGIWLSMSSSAMGSYICSIILTTVMAITSTNGEAGWVPPNLNDGHLDRYFFLLAALTAINLVVFVICAKRYTPISFENRAENMEMGTQEQANEA
ncbi:hypothetical protein Gogos_020427 [Gossypium gossypioides]|uniref:Uncharacterized protein n=1 Tax=Gossypium gossypioides TaxID=34282 RepID=A0A7J9D6C8_GOSGO|nr:hypothetical protein [Gossypium gossypioides]